MEQYLIGIAGDHKRYRKGRLQGFRLTMNAEKKPLSISDAIGVAFGIPITAFLLLLWSPFILLFAIFNLFAGTTESTTDQTDSNTSADSGTDSLVSSPLLLLVGATALFGVFVFILNGGFSQSNSKSGYSSRTSTPYQSRSTNRYGDVHVRGHFRDDGTYVPPHYRTHQNHTIADNYSTYPNVNPHTGEVGTQRSSSTPAKSQASTWSPARSNLPSVTANIRSQQLAPAKTPSTYSSDERRRADLAARLSALGVSVDWREHTWLQLHDMKQRKEKANEVTNLGEPADWTDHTWLELHDFKQRIEKANELEVLGHAVDWHDHTWLELHDMKQRIKKASELSSLGLDVDWKQFSWLEMNDAAYKIRRQRRAKR